MLPLAGCISVSPPDKPIEINLNVTIQQEVLVRLQRDVEQLIQENPEAFPQPQQPQPQPQRQCMTKPTLAGCLRCSLALPAAGPAHRIRRPIIAARRAGLIGERYDGYLGLASRQRPAELRRQVDAVNIRRRALYSQSRGAARGHARGSRHYRGLQPAEAHRRSANIISAVRAAGGASRRASRPCPDYCV